MKRSEEELLAPFRTTPRGEIRSFVNSPELGMRGRSLKQAVINMADTAVGYSEWL